MTMLIVILMGAGVLFVASAMDNTPIVSTFQKIMSGDPIDWTGGSAQTPTYENPGITPTPSGGSITIPDKNGNCPAGYTKSTDIAGQSVCIKGP